MSHSLVPNGSTWPEEPGLRIWGWAESITSPHLSSILIMHKSVAILA